MRLMGFAREGAAGRGIAVASGVASLISGILSAALLLGPVFGSRDSINFRLGVAALILLVLAAAAAVMAVRIWRSPTFPHEGISIAPEHQHMLDEFSLDVAESDQWPPESPGLHAWRNTVAKLTSHPEIHREALQSLCVQYPRSLRYSTTLIEVLGLLGRHREAREEILRISSGSLRDETRAQLWSLWLERAYDPRDPDAFEASLADCLQRTPGSTHSCILDSAACRVFLREGETQQLELADRLSLRAFELDPKSPTIRGTRGSVLTELNRLDEAADLLEPVFETSEPGVNRTYSALYLAILARRTGNRPRARRLARIARASGQPFVLRRLKSEGL